jgi:hypothetical protein
MARSRADKIADGHKATQTKIARFGPDEPSRAKAQRDWTIEHQGRPRIENPYIRERVYSAVQMEQAKKHEAWAKANPTKPESENPHSWKPN